MEMTEREHVEQFIEGIKKAQEYIDNENLAFCISISNARKLVEGIERLLSKRGEPALLENQHKHNGDFLNPNAPWVSSCPNCGKKIVGKQTRYCKYCGKAVRWK
jgi:hypothetical protein